MYKTNNRVSSEKLMMMEFDEQELKGMDTGRPRVSLISDCYNATT